MTNQTSQNKNLVGDCLLDRVQLGEIVGMTPNAIGAAICRGKFPIAPIRLGRRLRWRASDVRQYLENGGDPAAGAAE